MNYVEKHWKNVSLFACSIGAYFSLMTYAEKSFSKCLFLSPIVDMKQLIEDMMKWYSVSEEELQAQGIEAPADYVSTSKIERIAAANCAYGIAAERLQYWANMFAEKTGRQLMDDELTHMAKQLVADSSADFSKAIELELSLASVRR